MPVTDDDVKRILTKIDDLRQMIIKERDERKQAFSVVNKNIDDTKREIILLKDKGGSNQNSNVANQDQAQKHTDEPSSGSTEQKQDDLERGVSAEQFEGLIADMGDIDLRITDIETWRNTIAPGGSTTISGSFIEVTVPDSTTL